MRCANGQTKQLSLSTRGFCHKHRLRRARRPFMQGLAAWDDRDLVQAVVERLRRACPKIDKIVLYCRDFTGKARTPIFLGPSVRS